MLPSVCWFLGLLRWHAGDLMHLPVSQFSPRKGSGSRVRGGEMSLSRAIGVWPLLIQDPLQGHSGRMGGRGSVWKNLGSG